MNETMTKREQIAAKMMAALVARCDNASTERLAWGATRYTDALLAELERTKPEEQWPPQITTEQQKEAVGILATHQPCRCVVCTCEDEYRCHGCGAKHCGTHPIGKIPNPVFEDGWIPHTPGDPMPCNPGTSVLIRLGDQSEFFTEVPEECFWQEIPAIKGSEIIAWKPFK